MISYLFAICIILYFIIIIYLIYIIFRSGSKTQIEDNIEINNEIEEDIRPYWETHTNPYPGYFEDIHHYWR